MTFREKLRRGRSHLLIVALMIATAVLVVNLEDAVFFAILVYLTGLNTFFIHFFIDHHFELKVNFD